MFSLHRIRCAGRGGGWIAADRLGALSGILPMFEEYGIDMRMAVEEAYQFRAAVASEADDACFIIIHRYE